MGTYERVAGLPLRIDSVELEGLSHLASPAFERHTTVVRLIGKGATGVGEDVTWDTQDQVAFQRTGVGRTFRGDFTIESFSERIAGIDLFGKAPSQPAYRGYRRWAFESAALDLALQQTGSNLADALGKTPSPVRFVRSMSLGHPPDPSQIDRWRAFDPRLGFKLDAAEDWDDELIARLAASGAVETVDLKGAYSGTPVDLVPDPELYARIATGLPAAWIEDPALTPVTDPVLAPHRERITWDAPIHAVRDIRALPFEPRMINFKPSRFGSIEALFDGYDHCRERGIAIYGGGQWELGPGRDQIQILASLFHPDTPNDVAPRGYNAPQPRPDLSRSPLAPDLARTGFRRIER